MIIEIVRLCCMETEGKHPEPEHLIKSTEIYGTLWDELIRLPLACNAMVLLRELIP